MTKTVIIRHKAQRDFTVLRNALLRDMAISWKALGILVFLLHLPPDFGLNLEFLAGDYAGRKRHGCGRDATRAGLRELEAAGYVTITRERDDLGQWSRVTWTVTDTPAEQDVPPRSENPNVEKPATAAPEEAKPTLLNTEVNKEPVLLRTTTAEGPRFHFPRGMAADEREAAIGILSRVQHERAQEILDELAATMESGSVRTTPLGFLAGLVRKSEKGDFRPVAGVHIATRRKAAERERALRLREAESQSHRPSSPETARQNLANAFATLHKCGA